MIYKITVILLTVAYLKDTQSVFLVNCPTNFNWNAQQSMCVQQSYCGGATFGQSNQNCGINYSSFVYQYLPNSYYNVFNHYSACQTAPCPCYHSTCQQIQTCYTQVPCYYWYIPKRGNDTEPVITTTDNPTTTTTTVPTTTTTTTVRTTTTTTTRAPTPAPFKKITPEPETFDGLIDIKLINIINSHNQIYSPVHVNNTNIVTKEVRISRTHQETKTLNGTTTISNNTTTANTTNCCRINSPKICKLRSDDSWNCYHRKYRRCGQFCNREVIYLRPRRIQYRPPTLIMPPPRWNMKHYYNSYNYHSHIDCSGCIYGGYQCSSACYKYNCNTNQCGYIDQEYFCSNYGGHGCSEYDGYFN